VMEIARLLTESYRVPFEFSVLLISPSLGIREILDIPEAKVYQDLLDNVYHATGSKGEKILYSEVAPDILLCDLWGDKIDFGDVQINEVVGQGAFGKVYRGVYLPTQTLVAIKEMQNLDSEALQAFSREVWMLQ
jgi:serine/threonine protein kinase